MAKRKTSLTLDARTVANLKSMAKRFGMSAGSLLDELVAEAAAALREVDG